MYFLRRSQVLPERLTGVQGLRLSLNSPVVSADGLPVGPSRAGILVHDEDDGRPNVTIAVRSLKSGEVAYWSFDGDLREQSSISVGVDGALSFGESMGFLFDEEIGGDTAAQVRAIGLWRELVIDEPEGLEEPQDAAADRVGVGAGGEVLELLDALDAEEPDASGPEASEPGAARAAAAVAPEPEAVVPVEPEPAAPVESEASAPVRDTEASAPASPLSAQAGTLSKFRWSVPDADAVRQPASDAADDAAAKAPADPKSRKWRKAPLAKLKLVKRKRARPAETRAWIQKLLTSF